MNAHRIAILAAAALLITGGLSGCSSTAGNIFPGGAQLPLPKFLFTPGDADVGAFTVNPTTGAVTTVAGSPFANAFSTTFSPCPDLAAADPAGKFLFVPDACNDDIAVFGIDQTTGALTAVTGSPFPTGTGNNNVQQPVIDPSGKFLYVPEDTGTNLLGFTIGANGALTSITGSPFAAAGNDEALVMAPNGKFLYVADANSGTPTITAFSINSTSGSLTPVSGSPFTIGGTPKFMAIDPSGKFLYVTSPEAADGIAETTNVLAFSIDAATGALTALSGSPFATDLNPQGIDVSPDGKFVFVANNADMDIPTNGNVSAYTRDSSTGALTAVPGSPFAAGPNPKRLAVDPSGKFLYVTNEDSDNMSAFAIDPNTGVLTQVQGSPFATNIGSEGVTITHQ